MNVPDTKKLAVEMAGEMRALTVHNSETERSVVQRYSLAIKLEEAGFVLELAQELLEAHALRWQAYELIAGHAAAFRRLGPAELEHLGRGIDSWWAVDSFARTLAGPAWCAGQAPDDLFLAWARSADRWWRRAALVSTVAWNVRSLGGRGDAPRTLAVCRLLAADHDDMVAKALSWALRMLAYFDPAAVSAFLAEYDAVLAGRVKREVRHKLATGLKNPRRPAKRSSPFTWSRSSSGFPPRRAFLPTSCACWAGWGGAAPASLAWKAAIQAISRK